MSLRWRLALAMGLVALVTTVSFGMLSFQSTRQRLLSEVDRSLVVIEVPDAVPGGESLPERDLLSGYEAQLIDTDGQVFQSTWSEGIPVTAEMYEVIGYSGRSLFSTVDIDGEQYRVRTIGVSGGAQQVARSLAETERVLASVLNRTLLLVLALTALAGAIGWFVASRVTAPLRRLTSAAEHIARTGDLAVPIKTSGTDEVGRLGAEFERMTAALAQSRADQRRLVQDAGHELRTPLTSLRTNLDLLRRYPDIETQARDEIVADLHAETRELTALVNEVVSIASGDLEREPTVESELYAIATAVAARYERRFDRAISVHGERDAQFALQPRAIDRALSCLIENACKFDTAGGPVEIEVSHQGLRVLDRGPGVPTAEREQIFERFYRATTARSLPGSGLGLSIVRDIAQRNGATAAVFDRDGGGASFEIRFDANEEAPWPPPTTTNRNTTVATEFPDDETAV